MKNKKAGTYLNKDSYYIKRVKNNEL